MPVRYRIEDDVLVLSVDGRYTPDELRAVGASGLDDPSASVPTQVLLDFSGAEGLSERTTDDLRGTARFFGERADVISIGAIVAPSDLSYGLMRMGAAFGESEGLTVEVFRTEDEARAWLRDHGDQASSAATQRTEDR